MFCNWIYEFEDEANISGNILTIATDNKGGSTCENYFANFAIL